MNVLHDPTSEVFDKWAKRIKQVVGKGHYSMSSSSMLANPPFARLFPAGNITANSDFEGNENASMLSYMAEAYADGEDAWDVLEEINQATHEVMFSMGFRRTRGPLPIQNADSNIKRTTSYYQKFYSEQKV